MVRRSVFLWVAVFVGFYALATFANDWSKVADELAKSVVYIDNAEGSCSGFVINADARRGDKDDKATKATDFVLTAAHCDGAKLYADHVPANVIYKDDKKDLMVLEVENLDRPALKLAASNPKIGDSVASFGYGFGLERAMFRTATISDDKFYIPEDGIGGPFIVTDAAFVGGQSGGPVANLNGEVVLIVQRGGQGVGIGVGAEIMRAAVGRFFAR
jgi:S1-C subfamily serine protease